MLKKIMTVSIIAISLTGCGANSTTPNETISYTMDEVAKHNTKEDCWTVIEGNIYNITPEILTHKGGEAILKGCGVDGTTLFSKHPESAKNNLKNYLVHALE